MHSWISVCSTFILSPHALAKTRLCALADVPTQVWILRRGYILSRAHPTRSTIFAEEIVQEGIASTADSLTIESGWRSGSDAIHGRSNIVCSILTNYGRYAARTLVRSASLNPLVTNFLFILR